jgi:hypothetical protein
MSVTEEFVRDWLKKADNDLKAAQLLLDAPEAPVDTICFHAQQAAEKVLKGLLTARSIEFPKTHSLLLLLDLLGDDEWSHSDPGSTVSRPMPSNSAILGTTWSLVGWKQRRWLPLLWKCSTG